MWCNPSIREVEARGLRAQDQPQLFSELEASLSYMSSVSKPENNYHHMEDVNTWRHFRLAWIRKSIVI